MRGACTVFSCLTARFERRWCVAAAASSGVTHRCSKSAWAGCAYGAVLHGRSAPDTMRTASSAEYAVCGGQQPLPAGLVLADGEVRGDYV
jgi:hypothetical protein